LKKGAAAIKLKPWMAGLLSSLPEEKRMATATGAAMKVTMYHMMPKLRALSVVEITVEHKNAKSVKAVEVTGEKNKHAHRESWGMVVVVVVEKEKEALVKKNSADGSLTEEEGEVDIEAVVEEELHLN
jgi:hypothetical protein